MHDETTPIEDAYLVEYQSRINLETISPTLRRVYFYGEMREVIGEDYLEFKVGRPCDLVRAVVSQIPETAPIILRGSWRVFEGDRALEPWELYVSRPAPAPALHLVPAPEGEGRAVAKIFGGLFLMFLAPLGFAALFGASVGSFVLFGGVMALSGVASLFAPTPASNYQEREDPSERRPSLFSAGSTLREQGEPIALAYGTSLVGSVRVGLLLENKQLGWALDETELRTVQHLSVVDLISEGEIQGIQGGKSGVYLQNVPLQTTGGGDTAPSIEVTVSPGDGTPADLPGPLSRPIAVKKEIPKMSPASIQITDPEVNSAIITLFWPSFYYATSTVSPTYTEVEFDVEVAADGGAYVAAECGIYNYSVPHYYGDGNVWVWNYTTAYDPLAAALTIQSDFDPGPYLTFYSINLVVAFRYCELASGVPIGFWPMPEDGVDVSLFWRTPAGVGVWNEEIKHFENNGEDDSHPSGGYFTHTVKEFQIDFPSGITEIEVYSDLTYPVIDGVDQRPCAINIDEMSPAFYDTDPPASFLGWDGIYRTSTMKIAVGKVVGRSFDPYYFDFTVTDLSQYGSPPYDIRITRTTDDLPIASLSRNSFSFDGYQELIEGDFDWGDVGLVYLVGESPDVSSGSPRLGYILEGIKVRVPSGFVPSTGQMPAVWDGTFDATPQFTSDPAWILYDLLTNSTYGLGLTDDEVDWVSFGAASRRNGESVDDWEGGTQLRYEWNGSINRREDSLKVLTAVASCMDAQIWTGAGIVYLTQDRPGSVVRLFTDANVVDGNFEYIGTAATGRPNIARVSYREPAERYSAQIVSSDRPYQVDRFGEREVEHDALGVTNLGQASRRAKYILVTSEMETQQVKFKISIENALMNPGDLIEIADSHREGVRIGGRIESYFEATPTLWYLFVDDSTGLTAGNPVTFADPDGSLQTATVTSILSPPTYVSTLIFIGPTAPSPEPVAGAPFVLPIPGDTRIFRVIAIAEDEPGIYEVTGVEHDASKWTAIESPTEIGSPTSYPADTWPPT